MAETKSSLGNRELILERMGYTNLHVDFHNPGFQKGIGKFFDGESFAERLRKANIDSVTFFANCYHGYSYYDTEAGTRHPGLEKDLLTEVVQSCHKRDIKVIAYLSVTIDTRVGFVNPEWAQVDSNGERLIFPQRGWICMNSPYTEEVFFPQIDELTKWDLDGFFFDELYYHANGCFCPYCTQNMKNLGMDLDDPEHRRIYIKGVCEDVARETYKRIACVNPDFLVVFNPSVTLLGIMGNLSKHENTVLIGGHEAGWGTVQFPLFHRYVRNLGRPVLAMTGIFHRAWGDFGTAKHEVQMEWEVAQRLTHHFRVSIGDHLRPEGVLEEAKYKVIEKAFKRVKDLSLPEATPLRDIAVVYPGERDYRNFRAITPHSQIHIPKPSGITGATKLLVEKHQQFDVLDEDLVPDMLKEFEVAILPETGALTPRTVDALRRFVEGGGSLLATGNSSLRDGKLELEDVLGIRFRNREYQYKRSYIDLDDYRDGIPDLECVAYGDFFAFATEEATVKARVVSPGGEGKLFTAMLPGPPGSNRIGPAITHNRFGQGQAVYIGTDIFTQFFAMDYHGHGTLLDNVVTSLQKARVLDADAPASLWVNAMRAEKGTYVHLLNYHANPQASVFPRMTSVPPPLDVVVRLHAPQAKMAESLTNGKIEFERQGDYAIIRCSSCKIHEIVRVT
jgi:hypothetical protein